MMMKPNKSSRLRSEFKTKFEVMLGTIACPSGVPNSEPSPQACDDFFLLKPDTTALERFFLAEQEDPELKARARAVMCRCLEYVQRIPETETDCIRSKNALECTLFLIGRSVLPVQEVAPNFFKVCASVLSTPTSSEQSSSHTQTVLPVNDVSLVSLKRLAVKAFAFTASVLGSSTAATATDKRDELREGTAPLQGEAALAGVNIIEPAVDLAGQCLALGLPSCKEVVMLLAVLFSSFSSASYVCAMMTRKELMSTLCGLLSSCLYDVVHTPEKVSDNANGSVDGSVSNSGGNGGGGGGGLFGLWGLLGFSHSKQKSKCDDGDGDKDDRFIGLDSQLNPLTVPTLFVLRELIRLNQHFKECATSTMIRQDTFLGYGSPKEQAYNVMDDFARNFLEALSYTAERLDNKPESHATLAFSLALDVLLDLFLGSPKDLDAVVAVTRPGGNAAVHGPAVVLALNEVSRVLSSRPLSVALIGLHTKILSFCQCAINSFFSSPFLADSPDHFFCATFPSASPVSFSSSTTAVTATTAVNCNIKDVDSGNNGNNSSVLATADWGALWDGLFRLVHLIVVVTKASGSIQKQPSQEQREKLVFAGKLALEILGVSLVQANHMAPRKPAAVEKLWYEFMRTRGETAHLLSVVCCGCTCSEGGNEGWWSTGALLTGILGVLTEVIDAYQSMTITMDMVPSIIQEARKKIYSDDKIVSLLQPLEPKNPFDEARDDQQERHKITDIILHSKLLWLKRATVATTD